METLINQTSDYLGEDIQQLVEVITNMVALEKIICFGGTVHRVSKRNCFEESGQYTDIVKSAYSLLLIPQANQPLPNVIIQQRTEEATKATTELVTIIHSMDEVNAALENGSSFFSSIYQRGVLIYDGGEQAFATPGQGKPIASRIANREKFWDKWHGLAVGFLQGAAFYRTVEELRLAVYMLHQSVRHCYIGVLRVITGYHVNGDMGLARLSRLADATLPDQTIALPHKTASDIRLTGLLLKGYRDARYNDTFDITSEDVSQLMDCVSTVIKEANQLCLQRIQQLKDGTVAYRA